MGKINYSEKILAASEWKVKHLFTLNIYTYCNSVKISGDKTFFRSKTSMFWLRTWTRMEIFLRGHWISIDHPSMPVTISE